MRPLYIFDLDGTLALVDHRRHFVENGAGRWREFYAACVDDRPNVPVIRVLNSLIYAAADIRIFSGRSDEVQAQTVSWLLMHTALARREIVNGLRMRKEGDYTPDEVLKKQWLDELSRTDRQRLTAVFDDRDTVEAMWRENGVPCFQVAPGDF